MRAIFEAETLQIHTTNACVLECANCTHLVGHHKKPYMMTMDEFRAIVDSLAGYPRMIGLIGGEPLISPWAKEQFAYLRLKFPREQLGLWSVFPYPEKYAHLAKDICDTFGNILLNDHSVPTIMHAPMLVASGEYYTDKRDLHAAAWKCWVANAWSPGITPKGGYFCEVAGEIHHLFEGPDGFDITEPGWWKRTPSDYLAQIEFACAKCGGCLPLERRSSQDNRCDISEGNAELLKGKSRKVDMGKVAIQERGQFKFDQRMVDPATGASRYPDQSMYKDEHYRQTIASRYGIRLVMNSRGYYEPTMAPEGWKPAEPVKPLFEIFEQKPYAGMVTEGD